MAATIWSSKLIAEADRHTEVTLGFLYAVARNIVKTYWRKKYRERRRFCRLYEGDKGEMIADGWKFVTPAPDMEARIDARTILNTLPERMVKAGVTRALAVLKKTYVSKNGSDNGATS